MTPGYANAIGQIYSVLLPLIAQWKQLLAVRIGCKRTAK